MGYYFNAMRALPFAFKLISIWSAIDPNPNYFRRVLKAIYLVNFILIDTIINELVKMFLIILSFGFYVVDFLFNRVKMS